MSLTARFINLINLHHIADRSNPPAKLFPFIWYYVSQFKLLIASLYILSIISAALNTFGPYILRQLIDIILHTPNPQQAWPQLQPWFLKYIGITIVTSIGLYILMGFIRASTLNGAMRQAVRLQIHLFLLKQPWSYFQNDFAGRLATKVMEMGHEIRNITMVGRRILVIVATFVTAAITLLMAQPILLIPFTIWLTLHLYFSLTLIPNIRRLSIISSNIHSGVVGRVVDVYTNILTIKLFTGQNNERTAITETMQQSRLKNADLQMAIFWFDSITLLLEAFLVTSLLFVSIWLWSTGHSTPGTIAMVIPLSILLVSQAANMREEVANILESLGTIDDGINTLIHPLTLQDAPTATPLAIKNGQIAFTNATFAYHAGGNEVLQNLNLTIPAGQRVGLIGSSGAGKSTLVNLLLRFFDLSSGTIEIDGQNISHVTQNSLRAAIGMVTQDTSLLHRSIRENIAYGKPDATEEEVIAAAKLAHAHTFILGLSDKDGRTGYAAHVGERGVKLSGGQRQRIAIARLILKNAPILILDEATAALDSEVEFAIHENLTTLMQGKTVIAIAHRLSTIAQMDRLLVLENGTIVEDGTHAELLQKGGAYAKLWARQSGGFLPD